MKEVPDTDSGYPTARDDLPSSSRSDSSDRSPKENQLTSTPIRGIKSKSIKAHFSPGHDLSIIEPTGSDSVSPTDGTNNSLEGVKTVLAMTKQIKKQAKELGDLKQENSMLIEKVENLTTENESLREENISLREEPEQSQYSSPKEKFLIPKLELHRESTVIEEQFTESERIKRVLLQSIENKQDRTRLEAEMKNVFVSNCNPSTTVFTATANIQVDTETIDANVQTENGDGISVINANLQLEVDQLNSQKEVIEKKNTDLENRLFDYEQLKRKFEEDKLKLITDLERKLKASQEKLALSEEIVDDLKNKLQTSHDKLSRSGERAEEVQARLNSKRKQLDEVKSENYRLLEDQKTHEFELDEVKVNAEEMEKKKNIAEEKVEQLQANLEKVQKLLEEEKLAKAETKKDLIRTEQNYEKELSELTKKVEKALARESEVNAQLETIKAENKELTKENKYLTESRQKLIESEMNLKNDVSVQSVNLRDQENQLMILKEEISKKERQYHELETKSSDLETLNRKLNEDKYESEELLSELQKKQQEIDHLRQKVSQLQAKDSEQLNLLNEKIKDYLNKENHLNEELNEVKRQEREAKTKLDEYIGTQAEKATTEYKKLSEEVAKLKETIQSITEKAVQKEVQVVKLEKDLETKRNEFEEFKFHANLQYENEITEKEQQISTLRSRLVELETYPGKVVSISRKAASVQTDEVVEEKELAPVSVFEERDVSQNVTLVSEEFVPNHLIRLEERVKSLASEMKRFVAQNRTENTSTDLRNDPVDVAAQLFQKLVEFLDAALSENQDADSIGEEIEILWNSLSRRIQHTITKTDEAMRRVNAENKDRIERSIQLLKEDKERLKEMLNEKVELAENRYEMACQFKELFESEEKLKDDVIQEIGRLQELRKEEMAERDETEKELRSRLEQAQREIQRNERKSLKRSEEYEESVLKLSSRLQSADADHKRQMTELKGEIKKLERKRADDKETMLSIIESADITAKKCYYLKGRNTERQKLLNDAKKAVEEICGLKINEHSRRKLDKFIERTEQSGLLANDDVDAAVTKDDRKVLGNVNKTK